MGVRVPFRIPTSSQSPKRGDVISPTKVWSASDVCKQITLHPLVCSTTARLTRGGALYTLILLFGVKGLSF